jgi:hypothetical protein
MKRPLAVAVFTLLALPAAASAHPGVYTVNQKVRPTGQTCVYPDAACLTTAIQYAVGNDGWAKSFTEDNGVVGVQGDGTAGMINYKAMPSAWRAPMTSEQKRTFADAQTNLQAHATCANSALLDTAANILAWQEADPFFNYIPWQKTSAGLGDDPAHWIPVVKAATGVDLSKLITEPDFQTACESAPVNGVYRKADTGASITSALETSITDPLKSQITSLQTQVGTVQGQLAAAQAAATAAETARQALANRPLALTLSSKKLTTPVVMVTGTVGTAVTVTVKLSSSGAKELKLSRTIATKKVTLGAPGAALVTAKLTSKAAKAIKKHGHAQKVTVAVAGGGTSVSATASVKG